MIKDGEYTIKLSKLSKLEGVHQSHAVKVSLMDKGKVAASMGAWWRPDDPLGLIEGNLGQIMSLLLGIRKENTHGG